MPNHVGFETYKLHSIGGIVTALENAGVGFGTKGKSRGAFYDFHQPPAGAVVPVKSNLPS
jgi:hypothetical protein